MSGWKKLAAASAGGIAPWDISSPSLVTRKTLSGLGGNATGIVFSSDGTKLYTNDNQSTSRLDEYDLSTAWAVTTATYNQTKVISFTDPTWGFVNNINDLYIKDDGSEMFFISQGVYRVYPFTFGTAYDISTLSWDNTRAIVTNGAPRGLEFKPDGTSFYVTYDSGSYGVEQYDMTTAWDVSTASFNQRDGSSIGSAYSIRFHPNGDQMFIVLSNELIAEYSLSTPWDISTTSFVQNSPSGFFSGTVVEGSSLFFQPDGSNMYFCGQGGTRDDQVQQASL
jgi:hypothetical protein